MHNHIRPLRSLAALMLGLLLATAFPAVHGFHFPWDQGHDTTDWNDPDDPGPDEDPTNDPCNGSASPVYLRTGDLVWTETDIDLAGRIPIRLKRTYNSRDPSVGIFGTGWATACTQGLYKNITQDGEQYVLRYSNGKRYIYKEGDSGFVTPPGRNDRLEEQPDTSVHLIALDGSVHVFAENGRLVQWLDRRGNALNYTYEPATGLLDRIQDGFGRYLQLSYDTSGKVTVVADHAGRQWGYAYDGTGNLVEVVDPVGGTRRFEYRAYSPPGDGHSYQQLTRITDESGVVVIAVSYDGLQVSSYTQGSNTFSYTRNDPAMTVTKRDSQSSTWLLRYNDHGQVTTRTDPLGFTTTTLYDENGQITRFTDEAGKDWETTHDSQIRKSAEENPLGERTLYGYSHDKPWPTSITSPDGRVTTIAYNANGSPVEFTDPAGQKTVLNYDARGDLQRLTDPLGNSTEFAYDPAGHVTAVTDALGRVTTMEYDERGNRVRITNAAGDAVTHVYDLLDRKISTVNREGETVAFEYDAAGRRTRIVDPKGNDWSFTYDQYGRLVTETGPDGVTTTFAYRTDNEIASISRPNNPLVAYQYDADKRVTRHTVGASDADYTYDPRDNVVNVAFEGRSYTRGYDDANRLVSEGGIGPDISFVYNVDGERVGYAVDGRTVTFTRDQRGAIAGVTLDGVDPVQYVHDAVGRLSSLVLPNGLTSGFAYDSAGQLVRIDHDNLEFYAFENDNVGRVARRTDSVFDWRYTHDKVGRLVSALNTIDDATFVYDAVGNRLDGGASYDSSNRLVEDATYDYSYDDRGSLTSKTDKLTGERWTYGWNSRNRLAEFSHFLPGGALDTRATYEYDHHGRRVSKNVDGVSTEFQWAGNTLVREYRDGVVSRLYVYDGSHSPIIVEDDTGNRHYVHTDQTDTPQFATDPLGRVVWRAVHLPFGQTSVDEDPDGDATPFVLNIRFPGQYYDAESGLHYNYSRYYDPAMGRYLSRDRIGLAGGINAYVYADNNPVQLVDPLGEQMAPAVGGWIAGDVAIPDPSDAAWPKWAGYAVAMAGALALDYILHNEITPDDADDTAPADDSATEEGGQCPAPDSDRRHSPDREALNDLIDELTNGGRKPLSESDADTILDWADEVGVEGARDDRGTGHWEGGDHIHVPGSGINHIPSN